MAFSKRTIFKILKIFGWTAASLLALSIAVILLIRLPAVQSYIIRQALGWFSSKVDTEASIKGIYIDFPADLVIDGLYLEDQSEDTLVYFEKLSIDADLWDLTGNRLNVEELYISGLRAGVYTGSQDSSYNFQFIVDAFQSEEEPVQEEKQTQPFELGLEEVTLENISVRFHDVHAGIDTEASIKKLNLLMEELDLIRNLYDVGSLSLSGVDGYFERSASSPSGNSTESAANENENSSPLNLNVNKLDLGDINFRYSDPAQLNLVTQLGELKAETDSLDINENVYAFSSIEIVDTDVLLELAEYVEGEEAVSSVDPSTAGQNLVTALTKQIDFSKVRFRMIQEGTDSLAGFDPNHLDISVISLKGTELRYENEEAWGTIEELSAASDNDFKVHEFSAEIHYGLKGSYARNLQSWVENSRISGDLKVTYPEISTFADSLELTAYDVDVQASGVRIADASYFAPLLDSLILENPFLGSAIDLDLKVLGRFDSLSIGRLNLETLDSTQLKTKGSVYGLPDINRMGLNLQSINIRSTKDDITQFTGDSSGLNWPETVQLNGTISGDTKKMNSRIKIRQSYGEIALDLNTEDMLEEVPRYKGVINFPEFQLGKLLDNAQLGDVSGTLKVDAEGKAIEQITGLAELVIDSLNFSGYTYKKLKLETNASRGLIKANFNADDPNFDVALNASASFEKEKPEYQFKLSLNTIDLKELNYTDEIVKIRTDISGDAMFASLDDMKVRMDFSGTDIVKGEQFYQIDDFTFAALSSDSEDRVDLNSEILRLSVDGNYSIGKLPAAIGTHIQRYLNDSTYASSSEIEHQELTFQMEVKRPQIIAGIFLPELSYLNPGLIRGNFDSRLHQLNADMEIYEADYLNFKVDSLSLSVKSDENNLNASLNIASIFFDTLALREVSLNSKLVEKDLFTRFSIGGKQEEVRYSIGGIFSQENDRYRFMLDPENFMLNGQLWNVNRKNSITYSDEELWVDALKINKGKQSIQLQSAVSNGDSLLQLDVNSFPMSSLGTLADGTGPLFGGVLNVDFDILDGDIPGFEGSLSIDDFSFSADTIGNIRLEGSSDDHIRYRADLEISSAKNSIEAGLRYTNTGNKKINGDINIIKIDLESAEPFLREFISRPSGRIDGEIAISGTLQEPVFNGAINFNEVSALVNQINNEIQIDDQSIKVDDKTVLLNSFTIKDQKENRIILDGNITTTNYSDVIFRLDAKADNFTFINSTSEDNDLYYGKLVMNTDASIRGNLTRPVVRMNVHVLEASDFTYVIPQQQIEVRQREGVVQFFDQDIEDDPFFDAVVLQQRDTLVSEVEGVDLSAKIDTSPKSTLNIIVDPKTGDRLTVQGEANLNFNINPSGDISLTGRYEVTDGEYKLNFYSLAKREFKIQPGSYISWSGDPLDARLSITAIYTVRAFAPNSDRNLLYDVFLNINGELAQPEIGFRIGANEANNVSGQINGFLSSLENDESERNTQVFYLLVFQSFKSSDSVTGTSGGNAGEAAARNSVSQILSSQLNKLAGKIKGVELFLDLDSYQTGADREGRTQLELGVSKELFNDRVVVKLSSNVDLENQSNNSQDFSGDVRIEYKLTEDGRYRLVGFRENEFDNFLQGEVTKTGAGVIFVKDFNVLKELFRSAEKRSKSEASDE